MKILYAIGEKIGKNQIYIKGELCYTKECLCITNSKCVIMLDNIIKVEKQGNLFLNERVRIRNNSEYITIIAYLAQHTTKRRNQFVLTNHTNNKELLNVFNNYKHEVRNPIY